MAHQHDKQHHPDEFDADLERDSKDKASSSMEELVHDEGELLRNVPDEEQYVANPEPHHQHSRKGQAESPAEATLNQPEHKKHGK